MSIGFLMWTTRYWTIKNSLNLISYLQTGHSRALSFLKSACRQSIQLTCLHGRILGSFMKFNSCRQYPQLIPSSLSMLKKKDDSVKTMFCDHLYWQHIYQSRNCEGGLITNGLKWITCQLLQLLSACIDLYIKLITLCPYLTFSPQSECHTWPVYCHNDMVLWKRG